MPALLADENAEKYLEALLSVCCSPHWIELWMSADVKIITLHDLALERSVSDEAIWIACQLAGVILFTDNRNSDRDDSLQATIERHNTTLSLPVLTPGESQRLLKDRSYLERSAIRLMEILLEVDLHRGAGRLFLP